MIARRQRGIALIESLVAAVLLAVGLLGAIALQARSSSALADAGTRAEAAMAADRLLGTMAVDLPNLSAYALTAGGAAGPRLLPWYTDTIARIPHAAVSIAVAPAPVTGSSSQQVDITIAWTRKAGSTQNSHHVTAYLGPAP